jgi:hypothetical protein
MQLTVPDPILLQIGCIAVRQSHIEAEMAQFIHELLAIGDVKAHLITYRMAIWPLVQLLEFLLTNELGDTDERVQRFAGLRKELTLLVEQRNAEIHSMWSFGENFDASSATRTRAKQNKRSGSVDLESTQVTLASLKSVADRMQSLPWEFSNMRVELYHRRHTPGDAAPA